MASSRSKVNQSLQKALSKPVGIPALFGTIDKFEKDIGHTKDERAMVLVVTALLEQLLEDAILAHCVKAFDKKLRQTLFGAGPEGNSIQGFYGKIVLGQALGIYNSAFKEDLDRIRRIRNAFAHARRPIKFSHKLFDGACEFHVFDARISPHLPRGAATPANRFLQATALMSIVLRFLAAKNRRSRPKANHNKTWVYAEPPPSLPTAKQTNPRRRIVERQPPP